MKVKIELSRQGNFIFAILMIHFVFFGYIANVFKKEVGERILFLYQILFNPASILSLIILFTIVFFMVFREKFFEYGIRNSIWLIPIIIGQSWMWFWIINGFDIISIGKFFIRIEGWLTILSILGVNLFSAILASLAKQRYEKYIHPNQNNLKKREGESK